MANLQDLLEQYAALRNHLDTERAKLKPVEEAINNLQAALLAQMSEVGIESARSKDGHAVVVMTNRSARITDAEAFFDFVFDTGDSSFLQRRASTDAVLAFIDANSGSLPPGVDVVQANTLRFTKAKVK